MKYYVETSTNSHGPFATEQDALNFATEMEENTGIKGVVSKSPSSQDFIMSAMIKVRIIELTARIEHLRQFSMNRDAWFQADALDSARVVLELKLKELEA